MRMSRLDPTRVSPSSTSPPLITFEKPVEEVVSLLDAQEDDEIHDLSPAVATPPRRPAVNALHLVPRQIVDQLVSTSSLRVDAESFIPAARPVISVPVAIRRADDSEGRYGVNRIRTSGTINRQPRDSTSPVVDLDLLSSASSTPSQSSSEPSDLFDDSEDSDIDFRSAVLARRLKKLRKFGKTRVVSPVASTVSSRRHSTISLPGLSTSSFEITPRSYLSSRVNSPIVARDGLEIPISSEQDISRLFQFEFRHSIPEEDILVDIRATTKVESHRREILEVDHFTEEQVDQYEARQAEGTVVEDKDLGAKRLSVHSVNRQQPSLNILAPIFVPGHQARLLDTAGATTPNRARCEEGSLVDLLEPAPDSMKRMSQGQVRSGIALVQRISRPSNGLNGDGDLIDIGQPVASSSNNRGRNDNRDFRQRMNTRNPTSGRLSRSSSPVRGTDSIRKRYAKISPYKQLLSKESPRLTIPPHLLDPNGKDPLQRTLMSAWQSTEPSEEKKEGILELLEKLSVTLNQYLGDRVAAAKGKRRFEVDVFGSVSWGGETGESGDLDLIVLDHKLPQGYHPSFWRTPPGEIVVSSRAPVAPLYQVPPVYIMRRMQRVLEAMDMKHCQAIISATTPIVKFQEPTMQLECDINVNDLGGWYNSSLILHYCSIAPYVLRPMIHGLKLWAKAFNLNDPSGARGAATMSSYCLTLMAIAYLQHRGILPNLQANVQAVLPEDPARDDPDCIWVGFGKEQGIKAHIGFDREPPQGWKPKKNLTAADALRGFFSFFNGATDDFKFLNQVVSVLQGGVVPRAKEKGGLQRAEETIRHDLQTEGASLNEIKQAIKAHRMEVQESERMIGKGDKGIQPNAWEERLIVVQDPFLWHKNCAGSMSGDGTSRFQRAIAHTASLLQSKDVELEDILHNPNPVPSRTSTPRRGGFGQGGRGRGAPSPVPRPDSTGSTGSRGGGGGRGRGRGRGRGGGIQWNSGEGRFIL